jgi:tetratricopeptide (TPR) repeat protein
MTTPAKSPTTVDRKRTGCRSRLFLAFAALLLFTLFYPQAEAQNAGAALPAECQPGSGTAKSPAYAVQLCFSEHELLALKSAIDRRRLYDTPDELQTAGALAAVLGVRNGVIEHLFRRLSEEDVAPEDLAEKLAAKVKRHKDLMAQLQALSTDAGFAQQWSTILAEIENGQYSNAEHLTHALQDDRAADPRQPVAAGFVASNPLPAIEAVLGQIDFVDGANAQAAEHFHKASRLERQNDRTSLGYLRLAANALYAEGTEKRDLETLNQAAIIYRKLIQATPRDTSPDNWATLQDDLGNTLLRIAARERNAPGFEEAVAAFESALQVRTQQNDPRLWALTSWHLALALFRQGLVTNDSALFEKSLAAYESALTQIKRREMPVEWGLIQNELGTVHLACGEREQGHKHFEEAVSAFRRALEASHPDRRPLDWGAKQNNLGTALTALADRAPGSDNLGEAIQAFKASLAAYQEASAPFYIVGVRKNLARAEAMLDSRQNGSERRR